MNSNNPRFKRLRNQLILILLVVAVVAPDVRGQGWNAELVNRIGGVCLAVYVEGNYAYVGQGRSLKILDISNASSPVRVADIVFPGRGTGVTDVFVVGDRAYVAVKGFRAMQDEEWSWLQIVDISNPRNPLLLGSYGFICNSFSSLYVAGDVAYLGIDYSVNLVDVSNPQTPTRLGAQGTSSYVWDVFVFDGLAYVANAASGLQIIDVTNPSSPQLRGLFDTQGYAYGVHVSGGMAYVAEAASGLQIIDVTNPSSPQLSGSFDTQGTAYGVYVSGGRAYVADYDRGLQVLDVSVPSQPAPLGAYDTPGVALNVFLLGDLAFIADYQNGVQVVDVSIPQAPKLHSSYDTPWEARGVYICDNLAYIADGASGGLRIFDVSDPLRPTLRGAYDTPGEAMAVYVFGGLAYIADGNSGLQIIDVSNVATPSFLCSCDTPGFARDVQVRGNFAYVADGAGGLQIIDVSNSSQPMSIGSYSTASYANAICVSGGLAYIACNYPAGLQIVDVSSPSTPVPIASCSNFGGDGRDISVTGGRAYVGYGSWNSWDWLFGGGLAIIDVADPWHPVVRSVYGTNGQADNVLISDNLAYVVSKMTWGSGGLLVIDVSNPSQPLEVGWYALSPTGSPSPGALCLSSGLLYAADGVGALWIFRYTGKGALQGYIRDSVTGNPLASALISLGVKNTQSNSQGFYSIIDISPGTYTCSVTKDGYYSESTQVTFSGNETKVLNFSLTPSEVQLTMRLEDANGNPISVPISLFDSNFADDIVHIKISGYTPRRATLMVKEFVTEGSEQYVEYQYQEKFEVTGAFNRTILIPALPVFNNVIHTVSAKLQTYTLLEQTQTYSVEKGNPDMIILTNPEKLKLCFTEDDWHNYNSSTPCVLQLLQNAARDTGCFLYTEKTDSSLIQKEIHQTLNGNPGIEFLCIIGHAMVVPLCRDPVGDWSYWDINCDVNPDFGYARLELSFSKNVNIQLIRNLLIDENRLTIKQVNDALILRGRSNWFDELSYWKLEDDWVNHILYISLINVVRHALQSDGIFSGDYTRDYLCEQADFIYAKGHGNSMLISQTPAGPYYLIQKESGQRETGQAVKLLFHHDISPVNVSGTTHEVTNESRLNNRPLVYLSSCDSRADSEDLVSSFLLCGALGSAGFGTVLRNVVSPYFAEAYCKTLCYTDITPVQLGKLHKNTLQRARERYLLDPIKYFYKNAAKAFVQLGYPKQKVKISPGLPMQFELNDIGYKTNEIFSLPTMISFTVSSYTFNTDYIEKTISFIGNYNGESINSENWILQGNPIVPYISTTYNLGTGISVSSLSYTASSLNIGPHLLTWAPGNYTGNIYEYYPLNYPKYMPEPVLWQVYETSDSTLNLTIDIFPFQYDTTNHNITKYSPINISIVTTAVTAHILNAEMDDNLYAKGNTAKLTVTSIGSGNIIVTIDSDTSSQMTQPANGTNLFYIPSTTLSAGYHDVEIQLKVGEVLQDEAATGFTIADKLLTFGTFTVSEMVSQGAPILLGSSLTNDGFDTVTTTIQAVVYQSDTSYTYNLGSLILSPGQTLAIDTSLSSSTLSAGFASIQLEAFIGEDTSRKFASSMEQTLVYIYGLTDVEQQFWMLYK